MTYSFDELPVLSGDVPRPAEHMFSQFLRRFLPTTDVAQQSASQVPAEVLRPATSDKVATKRPKERPSASPAEQAAIAAAILQADAQRIVAALRYALGQASTPGDIQLLIESLAESMTGVLRRPPIVAQRALEMTRDPNCSVDELIKLTEQDVALGQTLLRFANSTYYASRGGPCVSLHAAVLRVGYSGVHNVALISVMEGVISRTGGVTQDLANQVWSHLLRTAPIARAIAPAFEVWPDEAYALALLHDAGKLVIFDRVATIRVLLRRNLTLPYAALAPILRMLHENLGAIAALEWGMGGDAATAIANHHRSPIPSQAERMSEVLYLAERLDLAAQRGVTFDLDGWWRDGGLTARVDAVHALLPARAA